MVEQNFLAVLGIFIKSINDNEDTRVLYRRAKHGMDILQG
jgi:hypothetical protein